MNFTILTIKPGGRTTSINDIKEQVRTIINTMIPISIVPYDTFKSATESSPVSLYIMDKKDKNIMSQDIQDVNLLKNNFFGKKKLASFTTPMSKVFNPRYMVIDVHDISSLGYKDKFAVRLLMSEKIPISRYMIALNIANALSTLFIVSVFSISKEKNNTIEAVTVLDKQKQTFHSLSGENSGVIGQYTKTHGISINKILSTLDTNVEILMAPKEIEEYESLLKDHKRSLKFINGIDSLGNSKEAQKTKKQIADIEIQLSQLLSKVKTEPNVDSIYIRIIDPKQLEKFKIRDVHVGTNKPEVWS